MTPQKFHALPLLARRASAAAALLIAAGLARAEGETAPAAGCWSIHEQETLIDQWHPSFDAPYSGANSFLAVPEDDRSFSFTLFLGRSLWKGAELYYNPEVLQGHGLSSTLGIAAYPNGEAGKAAFANLHYNTSRLFLRQTIGLGGGSEKVEDDENQVAGTRDLNRLTLSAGKFSASDFFDDNAYSHDARGQFQNWALIDSAAWDFPADVLGYTAGVVAELELGGSALRYGAFMEPSQANGPVLDSRVLKAWGQVVQVDRAYTAGERKGTLRAFAFWNRADMGSYRDTLAEPAADNDITRTRALRSKVGFGVSWDQELAQGLGAFARLSWNDGRTETWAFTEIDRSLALGLSLSGASWRRPDDVLALAGVANGLSGEHRDYLAAGGLGMILGDGRLNYGSEEVLEAYYRVKLGPWLFITPDFQFVRNPGYNRDRGPVPVYAVRAHVAF